MGNTTVSAADWIKFTAAIVEQAHDELEAPSTHPGLPCGVVAIARLDLESACARLEKVREMLRRVVALYYADNDMAHYASGRPVVGRLRMCDGSQYLHPWHPIPFQEPPRELGCLTTTDRTRKRIIVSAPGHLDSVTICEAEK